MSSMNTFNIHRALDLPKTREELYPFAGLDVGDAFEFQMHCVSEVRSAAQWVSKKHGTRFSVRKDKKLGIGLCQRVE